MIKSYFFFILASGYYAYIETSYPRKPNDTAALISPTISGNGTKTTYCMWFAYHMYGPHVDTLQVYTKSQGVNRPVIWQRKGSKGVKWRHVEVQVTVLYSTQVSLAHIFICLQRFSLCIYSRKWGFIWLFYFLLQTESRIMRALSHIFPFLAPKQ